MKYSVSIEYDKTLDSFLTSFDNDFHLDFRNHIVLVNFYLNNIVNSNILDHRILYLLVFLSRIDIYSFVILINSNKVKIPNNSFSFCYIDNKSTMA